MAANQDYEINFPGLPKFPDNVPTAPLLRLNLQKLVDDDVEESSKLWHACTNEGFFYLDLHNGSGYPASCSLNPDHISEVHSRDLNPKDSLSKDANGTSISNNPTSIDGRRFLEEADSLFPVGEQIFNLPLEEKLKYDFKDQGSFFGYKGLGAGLIDKAGSKDRNEFYNISKDDILSLSPPLPSPTILTPHRPLLQSFTHTAHSIATLLLTHLSTHLRFSTPNLLPHLHALTSPSGDHIRFVRSPPRPDSPTIEQTPPQALQAPQAALGAHTDFGSITILFNKLGGLQYLPPPPPPSPASTASTAARTSWLYIRPLPNHCVINLGDALVKLTAGVLKSATHRVVDPPGEQGSRSSGGGGGGGVRSSLVYFSRPGDDVVLRALRGRGSGVVDEAAGEKEEEEEEGVPAGEWTLRRALGRRGVSDRGGWEASRGTEVEGAWEVAA